MDRPEPGRPNRLAAETSPYLLQHAHNPVDWRPWGEEALAAARRGDRPILLSIGYSACHWCHVMAHESFEDPATAEVMNRHFVNIKVDREERPDLDKIYQTAHQLLMGRGGGWPLTVFLTPDQMPFFAGTYFPPAPRHGMPGFPQVLERVAAFYQEHRDRIGQQNAAVRDALEKAVEPAGAPAESMGDGPLAAAREQLEAAFDRVHGGFGGAPKFPHPTHIELLLHLAAAGDSEALRMADKTLRAMAEGGLYDHLGGGFFRYAVDARWDIPHFEKMLYDNGPLLRLYAEAWSLTGEPLYRTVAEEVAAWAIREMQLPEGGFCATLDADTEGEEGKFYLWTPEQAQRGLESAEYAVFAHRYGLCGQPNFEGRHYHLRVRSGLTDAAAAAGVSAADAERLLLSARAKLFDTRSQRIRPGRDEKVLTAWNALMVTGLATAGRVLERPDFLAAAESAFDFLRRELYRSGRLSAAYKDGRAHLNGYLDDYAFLLEATVALLRARWREGELGFARQLGLTMLEHFEDPAAGGFFFTSDDHETLIQRPKPLMDESLPSGNGVAARALARLGHLLGEERFTTAAERTLRFAWPQIKELPYAHATLLTSLEEWLQPPEMVVLRGSGEEMDAWKRTAERDYHPHRLTLAVPPEARGLPPALERPVLNAVTAYICSGFACREPIVDLERFSSEM